MANWVGITSVAIAVLVVGSASGQKSKPTSIVASYIMSWEMQNSACTGGDQQACRFRDAQELMINSHGWCLSSDSKWQAAPCTEEELSDKILESKSDLPSDLIRELDWGGFTERLEVVSPVTKTPDGWLVGEGCMTHKCDTDATAWAVSDKSRVFGAIIMATEKGKTMFVLYGDPEPPAPLVAWGLARGMTKENTLSPPK